MSFRSFVNLISDGCAPNTYSLRRIDMSWLIKNGNGSSLLGLEPPPLKDCCLPEVMMSFYAPKRYVSGSMEFMRVKNKVVATDEKGGALMYDPDMHAVRTLPRFVKHKNCSISLAVSKNLYILDRMPNVNRCWSFKALAYTAPSLGWQQQGDWKWQALPSMPPPLCLENGNKDHLTFVKSCAAVEDGSHIWVSIRGGGKAASRCTYSFDTHSLLWSKPVDWALPFSGLAEYIPELHKLWFGIASRDHGHVFCASDLTSASFSQEDSKPPVLHTVFDDMAGLPQEWQLLMSNAVHLGSGKFCIARFFNRYRLCCEDTKFVRSEDTQDYVVFVGLEVFSLDGELHVVKHNSERYMLGSGNLYWVL